MQKRDDSGFEPETSHTRSENHATRPTILLFTQKINSIKINLLKIINHNKDRIMNVKNDR